MAEGGSSEVKRPKKEKMFGNDGFPNTLEGFGYEFNSHGQLRNINTGEPFEFDVSDDNSYNQKHYEAMGEVVTQHIYRLLETQAGLQKMYIPINALESEPRTFVFHSDDALTNNDKLLLLIHGTGVVRAGQWSRRLIINDCLDSGTQLPFIKQAKEDGYGVIVLNTNDNSVENKEGEKEKIKGNESPELHAKYVCDKILKKAKAKHVAVIAHSYGGICTMDLVNSADKSVRQRVFAIALTDSVHSLEYQNVSKSVVDWLKTVCRNWISSAEPLDTVIPLVRSIDVPRVSAGVRNHEMTSWSSFKSVFRFLAERYKAIAVSEVGAKGEL